MSNHAFATRQGFPETHCAYCGVHRDAHDRSETSQEPQVRWEKTQELMDKLEAMQERVAQLEKTLGISSSSPPPPKPLPPDYSKAGYPKK